MQTLRQAARQRGAVPRHWHDLLQLQGIGHLKAACRKAAAAASASTTESDTGAASLNYMGQVSGNATVLLNCRKRRAKNSQQYELRVKTDEENFPRMDFTNGQLRNT